MGQREPVPSHRAPTLSGLGVGWKDQGWERGEGSGAYLSRPASSGLVLPVWLRVLNRLLDRLASAGRNMRRQMRSGR